MKSPEEIRNEIRDKGSVDLTPEEVAGYLFDAATIERGGVKSFLYRGEGLALGSVVVVIAYDEGVGSIACARMGEDQPCAARVAATGFYK